MDELRLEHQGVSLSALDFGGAGPAVVLLHGLAGYAGEWTDTASWLREGHRVLALDQRGHGGANGSRRRPGPRRSSATSSPGPTRLDSIGRPSSASRSAG
jgi:pimeloyl-ACP methyl ester carboxylesterase